MVKKKGKRQVRMPEQKREITDEDFEQLLNESFLPPRHLEIGEELEVTVIGFDHEHVYVDLGTRMDGMIRKQELMMNGQLMVEEGDAIKVFLTGQGNGVWLCTCRMAPPGTDGRSQREMDPQKVAALIALEEAFHQNTNVEGKITEVTKGGFGVQVMGLKSFCPLSQIDTQYCETPGVHLDKTYTFKIIQFEEGGNNIVISRKEYLEEEIKKKAERLWQQVKVGGIYKGTVTNVQDYGAFVDIGGIEGLLHISEIAYERIGKAGDKLKVGDHLEVAIKDIDLQKRKLSLSLKALMEDPWTTTVKTLKPGDEIQGKVIRLKTYGAFIQLFPGVDGMVHVSKLGTDREHRHPKEILKIGDMVTVRVLEVDAENRRISLTMELEEKDSWGE